MKSYNYCVILYVFIGIAHNSVADDETFEIPKEVLNKARCRARCINLYGVAPTSNSQLQNSKQCNNGDCYSCMIPCNITTDMIITCGTTVCRDNAVCLDSCDFQQSISSGKQSIHSTTYRTVLDPPNIICKNVSYGANHCKEKNVAGLFLQWNSISRDINTSLIYLLSMRYKNEQNQFVSNWTVKTMVRVPAIRPSVYRSIGFPSNFEQMMFVDKLVTSVFFGVKDLMCSTLYQFRVTAAGADGIIGQSTQSKWSKTLGYNYQPRTPLEMHVQKQSVVNQRPSATIVWNPGKDPSCSYQIVWLGHKSEQDEIRVNETGVFEYKKVNLTFSTNYKIRLSSSDYLFEHRSDELVLNLTTPDCLIATNYNHSACVPLPPTNLTLVVLSPTKNSDLNVSLSWNPPPHAQVKDLKEYRLVYRKEPLMGTPNIEPHSGRMTINASETSVEIYNLHNHNYYSFILSAVSSKGEGPSESKRRYFGLLPKNFSFDEEKDTGDDSLLDIHHRSVENDSLTALELLSVILIPVVLFLVLVGVICLIAYRRKRKYRKYSSQRRFGPVEEMNPIYDGIALNINTDKVPKFEADGYEVDYSRLDFISVIGEGAFGKVVKAEYYTTEEDRQTNQGKIVAVKMLRDYYTGDESRNFLLEIQAMKNLGHHPCIVSIIGCCLSGPKLCLIMDYCALGDLRNYLRKYREKLMYGMPATYGMMMKAPNCYMQDQMFQQEKQTSNTTNSSSNSDNTVPADVSEAQLLSYARQVTMGMEFLEQRKFIHRDLAARNILLFDNRHAKISDFGLTRDVYETNAYQPTSARKLPYKWMAIESLFTQRFTIKSDIWSFGIVLWEIVTLGGSPYPSIPLKDLYGLLNEGYRMEKPENCSTKLYQIMLSCWHPNPNSRPSFLQLKDELEKLLEETRSYIDLSVEVSEDYFNESTNESNQQGEVNTTTAASCDTLSQTLHDEYGSNPELVADVHNDVTSNNSNIGTDSITAFSDKTLDCDNANYLESVSCRTCSNCEMQDDNANCEHQERTHGNLKCASCVKNGSFKSVHSTRGKSHHLVKSSFQDDVFNQSDTVDDVGERDALIQVPSSASHFDISGSKKIDSTSV